MLMVLRNLVASLGFRYHGRRRGTNFVKLGGANIGAEPVRQLGPDRIKSSV